MDSWQWNILDEKLTGFGRPDCCNITSTDYELPLYNFNGGKSVIDYNTGYNNDDRDDEYTKPYPRCNGTSNSFFNIARSQLGFLEVGLVKKIKMEIGYHILVILLIMVNLWEWISNLGVRSFVSWVMDKTFNGDINARNKVLEKIHLLLYLIFGTILKEIMQ